MTIDVDAVPSLAQLKSCLQEAAWRSKITHPKIIYSYTVLEPNDKLINKISLKTNRCLLWVIYLVILGLSATVYKRMQQIMLVILL